MQRLAAFLIFGAALVVGGCTPTVGSTATVPAELQVGEAGDPPALPAELSVGEAVGYRDEGALIVDVRRPDEWAAGHIGGAVLIPLDELAARAAELPRRERLIVVCASGNRSAQGRDLLLDAGFPAVTSLAGGMRAWVAAGEPVERGP